MKKIWIILLCLMAAPAFVWAQSDCEAMLQAANQYYSNGEYEKAARMYRLVKEDCGSNYGGADAKLTDCNNKIKEDAAYNQCNSVEACDQYLRNYPNGRYVQNVQQKRAYFVSVRNKEAEDNAYANCTTIEGCERYLRDYPNGRYVSQVRDKLDELEGYGYWDDDDDDGLSGDGSTESDYTSFTITSVEFANTDANNNVIDDFGATLYASDLKYLCPRITYNGPSSSSSTTIYIKLIKPNGDVMSGSGSPSGYTYSNDVTIRSGYYNTYKFTGWGSANGGSYSPGTYKCEFWCNGSRIYQTTITLKDRGNTIRSGNWIAALKKCMNNVTRSYDNGSYKGEMIDGIRSGLGIYYWDDGDFHIGRYSSGKRNGMGIYFMETGTFSNCPNCVCYVGDWDAGAKSGTGTCYDQYGNLLYYGEFSNERPVDDYPSTGYSSYKFEIKEYTNGNFYIGETKNGERHGMGIFVWKEGGLWYGPWLNGERSGYGIYIPQQGSITTGRWNGDEME